MRYLFIILLAFASCSKSSTSENTSDTTQTAAPAVDASVTSTGSVYVGFAGYFDDTKEYYVSLYFKDIDNKISHNDFGDSIVVGEENDYFRKFIPMEKAREHFVLDGLETLRLYNADHQFLGQANLLRVEYEENIISSQYVAVYKFGQPYSERYGPYYAVSAHVGDAFRKDFSVQEINDVTVNARIIENLKLDSGLWVMNHYLTKPSGKIYSTVNYEMDALIVESDDNRSTIMEKTSDGYHFGLAMPIPILKNGKPILLVTYHHPEGDDSGDYLMGYDGKKYEGLKNARVD